MLCANISPAALDSRTLSNLVVDYVSLRLRSPQANGLGIHAFMQNIRTPRTMQVVGALLQHLHAHCVAKHGMPGVGEVDAYKFMSVYLFADRMHAHAQETPATAITREAAQPLLRTFSAIIARLRWLGSSGASFDAVSDDLTAPFLSQLAAFYNAHDAFAGLNREGLIARAGRALVEFYRRRLAHVGAVEWLPVCDAHIVRLRGVYTRLAGVDALDQFHARLTGENGLLVPALDQRL